MTRANGCNACRNRVVGETRRRTAEAGRAGRVAVPGGLRGARERRRRLARKAPAGYEAGAAPATDPKARCTASTHGSHDRWRDGPRHPNRSSWLPSQPAGAQDMAGQAPGQKDCSLRCNTRDATQEPSPTPATASEAAPTSQPLQSVASPSSSCPALGFSTAGERWRYRRPAKCAAQCGR